MANDTTPYLMVLLLNNDVWCKSREVVVLRNLIEQAWGKVLGEDNSITHLVVYPEVLSLVFDAANTYNAESGVLEQTAGLTLNRMVLLNVILGVVTFNVR